MLQPVSIAVPQGKPSFHGVLRGAVWIGGLLGAASAAARPAAQLLTDVAPSDGFTLIGSTNLKLGYDGCGIGDINGDGRSDFALTAAGPAGGPPNSGNVFVVFGQTNNFDPIVPILSLMDGIRGFQFVGETNDGAYSFVTGGDFNGDGLADLAIGAPNSDVPVANAGRVFVIHGRSGGFPAWLSASNLSAFGSTIVGPTTNAVVGESLANVGDFNGDGIDDLGIGAPLSSLVGLNRGQAYLVFGGPGFTSLNLASLNGTNGFRMDGASDSSWFGRIGLAGDLNNDGLSDLMVGAADFDVSDAEGRTYVIFGTTNPMPALFPITTLNGQNGLTFTGETLEAYSGRSSCGLGDFNGDGFTDVAIASPYAAIGGPMEAQGRAHVIFGSSGPFPFAANLGLLDEHESFKFEGVYSDDWVGSWQGGVKPAGDFNADGHPDMLVGHWGTSFNGTYSGGATVVFGGTNLPERLNFFDITGVNGQVFIGISNMLYTGGYALSGIGDINADGGHDFLISTPRSSRFAPNAGEVQVIYGTPPAPAGGTTGTSGGTTGETSGSGTGTATSTSGSSTSGTSGEETGAGTTGTAGGTTASPGTTGGATAGTGSTGGGTNQVERLDWTIALKRPKSGKAVAFKAGKKGLGTIKGSISDIELDPKTRGVQVQLALAIPAGGSNTNSNTAGSITFADADKVSKVSKKGTVKFSAKKFAPDADLESGDPIAILVRATEPDAAFSQRSTEIQTNAFEIK